MSGFLPNSSQQKVMDCRKQLCVIAGAGSGKTGTLVATILERLAESMFDEQPLSVQNLLALTFTEKAAAELRQRLGAAFLQRQKTCGKPDEAQFWRREAARLDRADIGTIHGYALKLVRENALGLGLSSAHKIEDSALFFERDLANIFTDWLDEHNEDLLRLLDIMSADRLSNILAISALPFSSWGLTALSAEVEAKEPSESDLGDFRALVTKALNLVENGDLNKTKPYYEKVRSAMLRLAENVAAGIESGQWATHIAHWQVFIKDSGDWFSKCGRPMKKELEAAAQYLKAKNDAYLSGPVKARILRLAHELPARLNALKQGRGVIDFDDILILARRLLATNPQARCKEIERRRLILIDEFQDTNRLQANILAYLLLDPNDTRVFPEDYDLWHTLPWPEALPRLAVFGDLKQSIYRFRGAEVEVMAALREALAGGCGAVLALDYNYRSQEPLIRFFNKFFQEQLGPAYTAHDLQKNIRPPLYDGPHTLLLSPNAEAPALASVRAVTQAAALKRYLSELFSGERGVVVSDGHGGSRLPRPGDVAVLFRQSKRAPIFKDALKTAWPCQTVFGDNPFSYAEVKALLAAFKYLSGLDEEISLAGALRSPLGPVSDSSLLALARPVGGGLVKLSEYFQESRARAFPENPELPADDLEVLNDLKTLFTSLRPRLGCVRPVEILEAMVEQRRLIPFALMDADGAERAGAITAFLAASRTIAKDTDQPQTAAEELSELAANWSRRQRGEETFSNAIKLMTVHGSKGLEFPIVIIAEADRRPRARSVPVIISREGRLAVTFTDDAGRTVKAADYLKLAEEEDLKDRAEDTRLLYVAATRAQDHLIFLGWPPKNKAKEGTARSWFETIAESEAAAEEMASLQYDEAAETPEPLPLPPETHTTPHAAPCWPLDLIQPIEVRSHSMSVTDFSQRLEPFVREDNFEKNDQRGKLKRNEAGNLFHAVLEKIDILNPQPRTMLRREAELMGLAPSEAEFHRLNESVAAFLGSPVGRQWHQSHAAGLPEYRELEFRLTIPGPQPGDILYVKGRIDLFHLTSNGGGRIVDYKFTTPKSGPELTAFEIQLRTYAQALIAAGFSGPLTAALYFAAPLTPHIHEVILHANPLSPHLPRLHTLWPLLNRQP